MFTVKADTPDIPFKITFEGVDSEGNPIDLDDAAYSVPTVESDNEDAVSFPDYDPATRSGHFHFGASGASGEAALANCKGGVLDSGGNIVGFIAAQFMVPPGDLAGVSGSFNPEGLTEDPTTASAKKSRK